MTCSARRRSIGAETRDIDRDVALLASRGERRAAHSGVDAIRERHLATARELVEQISGTGPPGPAGNDAVAAFAERSADHSHGCSSWERNARSRPAGLNQAARAAGAYGITLSGSGSTLVAIAPQDVADHVADAIRDRWMSEGVVADSFVRRRPATVA